MHFIVYKSIKGRRRLDFCLIWGRGVGYIFLPLREGIKSIIFLSILMGG